jgi:cation transport regulator
MSVNEVTIDAARLASLRQTERTMPYDQNSELPESVRGHLPVHAQTVFREAFNHAFAAHSAEPDCEQRAFRIAWSAVKRTYEKRDGEWVRRSEASSHRI